jgi:ABC-type phosphate transport system permease subunit
MTAAIFKNYLTTFFGILAGLPTIVLGVFMPGTDMALSSHWTHILAISGGIGMVGLGLVSKAFNVHSTLNQVEGATVAALPPGAPGASK